MLEIDHANLLKLDTQEAFDPSVAEAISSLEKTGLDQSDNFRKDVLENGTKEVHDTIKRNALPLLSTPLRRVLTAAGKKLKVMTLNNSVFFAFSCPPRAKRSLLAKNVLI